MGTKLQEMSPTGMFARALDDEPLFVLGARDTDAPARVREWATQRQADVSLGKRPASDMAAAHEAFALADRMEAWRQANDGSWRNGLFGTQYEPDEV